MAQPRRGHTYQTSVADAANLFGAGAGGGGGGDDSDPFASISTSATSGVESTPLPSMSEEQGEYDHAAEARGGQGAGSEAADLFGGGGQEQQDDFANTSGLPTSSSGLFGGSGDASGANDDWLGTETAAANYGQQQQHGYDAAADSTGWYDGAYASQQQQGYDAYGSQQAADGSYYQGEYDATAYQQHQPQPDQGYQQQWDGQSAHTGYDQQQQQYAADYYSGANYDASSQQQYAPQSAAWDHSQGYDTSQQQQASTTAGQYDYSQAAAPSQGQYDYAPTSQQQPQQDYHASTSYDAYQYSAADYSQYGQPQQAGESAPSNYDPYAPPPQQQQQHAAPADQWSSGYSQQQQRRQQQQPAQHDPYAPSSSSQSAYEPQASQSPYDPSSTPRANSGVDLPSNEHSYSQPQYSASALSYENSYDAQYHDETATKDAFGSPVPAATSYEQQQQQQQQPGMYNPAPAPPAASSAYDAPSSAYDAPPPAASVTSPPPPPKGPPKGPPRGPPRGPARGPSRASASARVEAQAQPESSAAPAVAPASDDFVPQSPALQINGMTAFDQEPEAAPTTTAAPQQSLDDEPAPWDLPTDSEDIRASSAGVDDPEQPSEPGADVDTDADADADPEASLAPPRRERQATPKLVVTGDDDSTKEIETTPSEPDDYSRGDDGEGNDTIIERRDSASSANESKSNDDDLDEATREFNDLHLIRSRSKSQSQSPVSSRRGASRASTRSAKKASAGEWMESAKASSSGHQEKDAGEEAGYGYGYGAGGESAVGETDVEVHDPYAPPAAAAAASDAYGEGQDAGYGYEAGYGGEAAQATHGAEDPYGPPSQSPQYDADPYAPQPGQADPYAPPAAQTDPYAPSAQSYAPSEESQANPYVSPSQQPAQDDANPYGPAASSQSGQYDAPSSTQYDPYAPPSGNGDPYAPAAASRNGQDGYGASAYNPYEPSEQAPSASAHDPYAPASQIQRSASISGEADPYDAEQGVDPYAPQQGGDPYAPGYGAAVGAAAGATAAAALSAYGSDGGWGSSVGGADGPYGSSQGPLTESLDTPLAPRPPGPPSYTGYSAYNAPPPSSQHARTDSQSRSVYGDEPAAAGPYGPSRMASGYFGSRAPSASYDAPSHASQDGFSQQGAPSPYELPRERMGGFDAGFADAPDPAEEKRNARIPLACFGIDGKIVTFFPTQSAPSAAASAGAGAGGGYGYGSDTAPPTKMTVRQLSHLVPPTSFASSFDPLLFPGPAFENTAVTSAIARATGAGSSISTSVKTKKATLIKFLRDAAIELEAGMGYRRRRTSFVDGSSKPLTDPSTPSSARFPGDEEAGKAEDRILLIRLLAIVLEQDGNVVNNPAFDEAVRALLLGEEGAQQGATFAPGFAEPLSNSGKGSDSSAVAPSLASPKHHDQIRELLLSGQRREAVAYATSQKLWSHAMVIASAVDQETWRRVANEFIEAEFGSDGGSDGGSDAVSDDASLKLAYGLFSGQEPSTIYGLFRSGATTTAAGWRKSAAVVLANRCAGDSAALTAVGDGLLLCGRQEAAHICYLLSPRTSPVSGVDPRMALLGAPSPMASTSYLRDLDAFILSEIYEFSHALIPPAKGQEAFPGLAHLQAYRLLHAWQLAELGEGKRAQKYCEAIAGVIKATKGSPFLHRTLVAQVKELSDRLVGSPHQLDSGGNWVTRKMQRPTLDGMLSAFEGRFAKFIAGDDDSAPGSGSATPNGGGGASGPGVADKSRPSGLPQSSRAVGAFSHYSAITPDAMSGGISRVQSFADFGGAAGGGISRPSSRAQSAAGFRQQGARTPSFMQQQQERAVSAMAGGPGVGPYGVPPASSSSVGGSPYLGWSRSDSPALGQGQGQHGEAGAAAPWPGHGGPGEEQRSDAGGEGGGHDDGYRGPSYGYDAESSNVASGVKPQFISNLDADFGQTGGEDGGGADFVSPMDAFTPAGAASFPSYAPQQQSGSSWRNDEPAEDDDDLGFGNSAHKRNNESRGEDEQRDGSNQREESSSADSAPEAKSKGSPAVDDAKKAPELKPSPSTSWLGRLWGRKEPSADAAATKAAQAHMGEESAFYYDKDLKRWVNKKAGDSGGAAATPPPPPRATTASPSMASRGGLGGGAGGGSGGPPGAPQRSFSAAVSRTTSQEGLSNEYRSGALGGGPGGPPRAASSAFNPSTRGTPPIAESGGFGSDRNTPSPPSSDGALPPSTMSSPGGGPRSMMGRTRSNLGDLNQPAAMQPPNAGAMSSSMPPPPAPPAARGAGAKKKPISKRYVRVD